MEMGSGIASILDKKALDRDDIIALLQCGEDEAPFYTGGQQPSGTTTWAAMFTCADSLNIQTSAGKTASIAVSGVTISG